MNHGPFVSSTIATEPVTEKAIAVKVNEQASAVMAFDTDLLRVSAAWTGGFLNWYAARDGLQNWPTPGRRDSLRDAQGAGLVAHGQLRRSARRSRWPAAEVVGALQGPLPERRQRRVFVHDRRHADLRLARLHDGVRASRVHAHAQPRADDRGAVVARPRPSG